MRCPLLLCLLALGAEAQPTVPSYSVTRIAGAPPSRLDGIPAVDALLLRPFSMAQDRAGNIFVSDQRGISMVTTGGQLRIVRGAATPGNRVSAAIVTILSNDPAGEILIAEAGRIFRRLNDGSLLPIAGGGRVGEYADGIPATLADLNCVSGLTSDRAGNIYTSCLATGVVRRISPDGAIRTFAGTFVPGSSGDGGLAIRAQITPSHLTTDSTGALYIYDAFNATIRRVTPDGIIRTIAGGGSSTNDGILPLNAALNPVGGLAIDGTGNIYFSESSAHRIRRFLPGSPISAVAGASGSPGDAGDNAAAGSARLNQPSGLLTDRDGNILLADTGNNRVRKLSQGFFPTITPVAGASHFRGDGRRATDALFNVPTSVAVDALGNVFIADSLNTRIRRVAADSGIVTTVAGTGTYGFAGDQGQATAAQFRLPVSVAVDGQGTLWIADRVNDRIRRVTSAGLITTVAGTGEQTPPQLAGTGSALRLVNPGPLVAEPSGNVLFAQVTRVSSLSAGGAVTAVAGGLDAGSSGDGGSALSARFTGISGLAQDPQGNTYVADEPNHVVRRITRSGVIQTVAGRNQIFGSSGDGGQATAALLNRPKAVAVDPQGNLLIADGEGRFIRLVTPDGIIHTVAGKAGIAEQFPEGQALNVAFGQIASLAADTKGVIYFADSELGIVGKLTPLTAATVTLVSGDNQTGLTESQLPARLVVRITDAAGVPVTGLSVNFWVLSGIAYLSSPSAITGADGTASVAVALGAFPGIIQIASSTSGLLPVTFSVTAVQRVIPEPPARTSYSIETSAGSSLPSDDGAVLRAPDSIATDVEGNVYFSDSASHRILMRTPEGSIRLYAGTGVRGSQGLDGFSDDARLNGPTGVAAGPRGSLYFADRENHRVLRITGDRVLQLVAGTGLRGYNGDRLPALRAQLARPSAVAVNSAGEVYVADDENFFIRKVQEDGLLVNVLGVGRVFALAVDAQDHLYIAEDTRILRLSPDGVVATVAGGDDPLTRVRALAFDAEGNLCFSDGLPSSAIRRIAPDGSIDTIFGEDLALASGIAFDAAGSLWIADTGHQRVLRVVTSPLKVESIAGKPAPSGDGGQAILALLNRPAGIALDALGNLYIADTANAVIRRVTPGGIIETIVPALSAPRHIALDSKGTFYFSDASVIRKLETNGVLSNVTGPAGIGVIGCLLLSPTDDLVVCNGNQIQRVMPNGQLQTIAGNGERAGFAGDGGPAAAALLAQPQSAVYDRLGNLYFADTGNLRIRKIAPNGTISTAAGTGRRGSTPDGRLALEFDLDAPTAVAIDAEGNLYIAEYNRIRKVSPTGVMVTIAGDGAIGFEGEGGLAIQARFDGIEALILDSSGNLWVSDGLNNRVRKLVPLD